MLISTTILSEAFKKYKKEKEKKEKARKKLTKENYNNNMFGSFALGANSGAELFFLIFAIVLFITEIILIFYLFASAIKCTKPGPERILHILLIFFFTYPYAFGVAFFGSNCSLSVLRNSNLNSEIKSDTY